MKKNSRIGRGWLLAAVLFFLATFAAPAADTLNWRTNDSRIDADISGMPLPRLLERVAASTGWQVFLEPDTRHTVSARFKDAPPGEALRLLLGKLNFAVVPQSNSPPRLYVFRTALGEATQLIRASGLGSSDLTVKRVANELIVTLKPGAEVDIEELARRLGAKVIGRIDELGIFRLQFEDAASTELARNQLSANPDVADVDSNYYVERPPQSEPLLAASLPPIALRPTASTDSSKVVIGLIDTAVQPMSKAYEDFFLQAISLAGDVDLDSSRPTHGTSMAETILRSLSGSVDGTSSVKILPVDVYGNNANTTTFDVALGIYKAVNGGANIINLSLGSSGSSSYLLEVIKSANSQGVIFFAAAGNQPTTAPTYPAAYSQVVAVTAGDRKGNIASYANYGSFVDVIAPGANIVQYNGQSYYVSGTSAATAFASGLAAGQAETSRQALAYVEAAMRKAMAPPAGVSK